MKGGDHEPATRAIHRNYRARVRLLGEAIERGDLFNVMLFRDAEGRAESTAHACGAYVVAKRATANRERTVAFDEERLAIVKERLGDVLLSTITRETIEGFQAKRKLDGSATVRSTWTWARCGRNLTATGAGCRTTSRC